MSVTALGVEKEYTVKEIADPTDEMTVESVQPSWVSVDMYTDENDQWVVVVVVDENTEEQERLHRMVISSFWISLKRGVSISRPPCSSLRRGNQRR